MQGAFVVDSKSILVIKKMFVQYVEVSYFAGIDDIKMVLMHIAFYSLVLSVRGNTNRE